MKAEKKKITLSFENYHLLPNYVRGDKDRIQQIIENLIVNSIKYGKIGGETEVAVVNLTKEKLIRISDDGEGIENKISLGF
jgi:two-component system phosphate regulon sensor histidine kinase PhoR